MIWRWGALGSAGTKGFFIVSSNEKSPPQCTSPIQCRSAITGAAENATSELTSPKDIPSSRSPELAYYIGSYVLQLDMCHSPYTGRKAIVCAGSVGHGNRTRTMITLGVRLGLPSA
jgi:hypothetical protein